MKRLAKLQTIAALAVFGLAGIAGAKNPPTKENEPVKGSLEYKVRHELLMLPYYTVFDNLNYRVDNGTVTLFGDVTKPWLKSDAENAVKHLEGVTRVDNRIEVLPLSPFDSQIRRRTYFAIYGYGPLERYGWGTQPSIRIIVKNGTVKLEGIVGSEADRNLAYIRANGVPNVFSVSNELRVE
jgi:hyperosmotically inducible protein